MWDDLAIVEIGGTEVFVNDTLLDEQYVRVKDLVIGVTSAETPREKIVVCAYAYDPNLDIFMLKSMKVFEYGHDGVSVREVIRTAGRDICVNDAMPGNGVTYERAEDFFVSITSPRTHVVEMTVCVSLYQKGTQEFVLDSKRTFDLKERKLVLRGESAMSRAA